MQKLTTGMVAPVRMQMRAKQGGLCALCKQPLDPKDAVLDHCHKHGAIRGALHRSCNSLLGVIENNRPRFGLGDDVQFAAWCAGLHDYILLHRTPQTHLIHPTFLTEDEKRLKRNKAAVKRRLQAKVKP